MIIKEGYDNIQTYCTDASNFKGAADKLYIPENIDELKELVIKANNNKELLTLSGAGTGLTGGRVPDKGAILSMEKFTGIKDFDKSEKTVVCGAGTLLSDIQNFAKKSSLLYPPDPTETNCSLGGTIANNASGAKSFRYGPTRKFIKEIKIVLPDGTDAIIERGKIFANGLTFDFQLSGKSFSFCLPDYKMPSTKNAAGYYIKDNMDLIDLFIGAEGTLGVVYEAKLQLVEKSDKLFSAVIFFDNKEDVLTFAKELESLSKDKSTDIDALGIEYFDKKALQFLKRKYPNIPDDYYAIWFEQELTGISEDDFFNLLLPQLEKYNADLEKSWIAFSEKERDKFKDFRHSVSQLISEYLALNNLHKVGTDTAVPKDKFMEFYDFSENLVCDNNLQYVVYGHIGDYHLHLNMLPSNEEELKLSKELYSAICKKSVELGGTISAEHGIGKLKRKYFLDMVGKETIIEFAKLKKYFDKNLILNMGNIIDESFYENI